METPHTDVHLSAPERLLLGSKITKIALDSGPEAALHSLQAGREPWYGASSYDRQSDLGGILSAVPYAIRGAILKAKIHDGV